MQPTLALDEDSKTRRLRVSVLHRLSALARNKVLSVRKVNTTLDVLDAGFAMQTKWLSSTRLETRTKESNIYASIWVTNPDA